MAKKYSTSQLKSKLRQIEQKQKQAVRKYNQAVNNYNRQIRKVNQSIRNYNSSVRRSRQIISQQTVKLRSRTTVQSNYSISTRTLQQQYTVVDSLYGEDTFVTPDQEEILNLVDQEYANGLITATTIEDDELPEENTEDVEIGNKLHEVSEDLDNRWKGAVYSLSPDNPDASRHFCTSSREIFTEFIEMKAPDAEVFAYNPNAAKTKLGNATRKEKIRYMMRDKGLDKSVAEFADADIDNILELFHILSDGTHGPAGRHSMGKLMQVKRRVEQGINFLCTISR